MLLILVSGVQCSDSIFLYTTNDHHKSSYHLAPYKVNTLLLTILPLLYVSPLWLIYFVTGSLYLLISLTYFTHPTNPLPSGSHLFVLWVSFVTFVHLFYFLDSTYMWKIQYLSSFVWLTKHNILLVHPCCCKWQNFILFMTEQHSHLFNPLIYRRALWLPPYLGYCK